MGLAARREGLWLGRAAALAAATLCLSLGMLSQSRGSMIAGAAALCVYVAFSRERARRLAWLALAVLPALLVLPALTDLYQAANGGTPVHDLGGELRRAGNAAILSTVVAFAIGVAASLLEARLPASARAGRIADRVAIAGLVAIILGGSVAFVAVVGDPLDWLGQKASEFQAGESSKPVGKESRFTLNARTGRGELWRIALLDFRHHPILGDGGGGYRYTYLRERRADAPPAVHDAHSVELENLSELGIVGLALFASAVAAAATGAIRARRFERRCGVGVGLRAHGRRPIGSSTRRSTGSGRTRRSPRRCSRCSARPARPPRSWTRPSKARGRWRLPVAGAAIVLAVSTVPPFLSERYVNDAYDVWRTDPARAYDDLDRARSLNPLSVDPLLAEGAIAKANGDRRRAIQAFQGRDRQAPRGMGVVLPPRRAPPARRSGAGPPGARGRPRARPSERRGRCAGGRAAVAFGPPRVETPMATSGVGSRTRSRADWDELWRFVSGGRTPRDTVPDGEGSSPYLA